MIPWTAACQAPLSFTISRVCSNSCPLSWWCYLTISSSAALFFCLQSFPASVFSNELALCIRWPKYWSFSLSISLSSEYSGLISFRIDWIDFLAVQGTLKSLLQHHNSKAQFFGTQPFLWSNSHIRTWLLERPQLWLHGPLLARWLMSLLFSMLSRFVIAFLPRTNCFLISWLQSPIYFNKKVTEYN